MELPDYARAEGKTVYVKNFAQALDIVDYIDDSYGVVIEDKKDEQRIIDLVHLFKENNGI
jgi:glutaredoxin 2